MISLSKKIYISAVLFVGFICVFSNALANEQTGFKTIGFVQYQSGNGDVFLFNTTGQWDAPSCPSANIFRLAGDNGNIKSLLAIALTAKASGVQIQGVGLCDGGNASIFNVTGLVLEQ